MNAPATGRPGGENMHGNNFQGPASSALGPLFGDPGTWLAEVVGQDLRGVRVPVLPFFGHYGPRGRPGAVGPWVLSQWWHTPFTVDGVTYPHTESYMMAAKARLFSDAEALAQLLTTRDPRAVKTLGRTVRGFDPAVWEQHAYQLVAAGNLAKFTQNEALGAYLTATAPALLVEASPYDRIWGIGVTANDPRARRPSQWPGRNLLGFALTAVREVLRG